MLRDRPNSGSGLELYGNISDTHLSSYEYYSAKITHHSSLILSATERMNVNYSFLIAPYNQTERRGRVVSTPVSYSNAPGSNIGQERGYPDWSSPWFSSAPPCECWDSTIRLCYDRFLPNHFQFIIHLSPFHSTLYTFCYCKCIILY
jgi:hypothetical protein